MFDEIRTLLIRKTTDDQDIRSKKWYYMMKYKGRNVIKRVISFVLNNQFIPRRGGTRILNTCAYIALRSYSLILLKKVTNIILNYF